MQTQEGDVTPDLQSEKALHSHGATQWLEPLVYDIRHRIRALLRAPGFTSTAILIMALGIGVNISLFSVVRGVLWTPLPYREPGRLVALFEQDTNNKDLSSRLPVDAGSFAEWQSATQGIAQFALVSTWQHYNISAEGNRLPEQIDAAWCSWNLFEVLGVTPSLGRSFTAEDDRPDAQATVMLTALLWQRRYGGDRSIVGRTIWLDSKPYIVIGVLPASFQFSGSFGGNTIRAWTAVRHEAPYQLMRSFEDHEFLAIARLASGTSMLRMAGRLDALQKQIRAERPRTGVHDSVKVRPMLDDAVAEFRAPLYSLFAFTGCVLAIACLNVAGLTIARMATRTKDVAIRVGLGAGYFRLVRERLIESLLLSFGGGAGGFVLALGAIRWFVTIRPEMTRVGQIDVVNGCSLSSCGTYVKELRTAASNGSGSSSQQRTYDARQSAKRTLQRTRHAS